MYKRLTFSTPFGLLLDTDYPSTARKWMSLYPQNPISFLLTHQGERWQYTVSQFDHQTCLWYSGREFGVVFADLPAQSTEFSPPYKKRYQGIYPFILYGYWRQKISGTQFVALDLAVWNDRLLTNVPFSDRIRLMRSFLALFVKNQPSSFLFDERITLPRWQDFPQSVSRLRHFIHHDLLVTDCEQQFWCPYWFEKRNGLSTI